jgi:GNAT superfamily N-acetyltransferase
MASDRLEERRRELAASWTETAARLGSDAQVLVAPAPLQGPDEVSFGIVMYEVLPADPLDDVELGGLGWSDYQLTLTLLAATARMPAYAGRGSLAASPPDNAPLANEPGELMLLDLHVWPELQGRGLGARLMRELIARARHHGFRSITGEIVPRYPGPGVRERLASFFRHLGFWVDAEATRIRLELGRRAGSSPRRGGRPRARGERS